ncbi:amidase domain-containing protein [Clostridium massiliamazoniense]|uniref:amidase domain-containing protein n=1 Tax=Clostridium massiliamazoniense TaxID=1347366 RepID=UPI0006D7A864|nr:amidase domain-containing protein [Clostridium massiliamazoniense]
MKVKTLYKIPLFFLFIISLLNFNKFTCISTSHYDLIKEPIYKYFDNEKNNFLIHKSNINLDTIINEPLLAEDLNFKYLFFQNWNSSLNINFSTYNYDLHFIDFYINNDKVKVHLIRNLNCILNNTDQFSSSNEEYIFFLEYQNNNWKIYDLAIKEENEDYFYTIKNNTSFRTLANYKWKESFDNIDNILNEYLSLRTTHNSNRIESTTRKYDLDKTIDYALKHALNYNNAYKNFDNNGGDCTNFVSQCLHAGGLPLSSAWKPYRDSWINVNLLRNYLIYNSLGIESSTIDDDIIGSTIQFYNSELNRYSHSGIVTSKLSNGDYGYCAHSYDKLNYPLSLSFPVIYKKIRIIKIVY